MTKAASIRADDHGAWVPGPRTERAPLGDGLLSGLRFAVKDLIDVAGAVTGCGNPDWAAAQRPAVHDAPVVRSLREAGARLVGKTITDELAFSLEGENAHYGTPCNPRAPDRLPGGSSSGSAVAVAAGLVDFALGTDTGGSVRVPASFCGVYGFRPTHGRVSLAGVLPFAPSYDTVGWLARDASLVQRIGTVLMPPAGPAVSSPTLRLLLARDVFEASCTAGTGLLHAVAAQLGAVDAVDVFDGGPQVWLDAYATLQGHEIRQTIGPQLAALRPRLGADIALRFASTALIADAAVTHWMFWRGVQTQRLHSLLANGCALVMPTTPGAALLKTAGADERSAFYSSALAINAIAGHAGLPQLSLPLGTLDRWPGGLPMGLSIVGARDSDAALLAFASRLTEAGLPQVSAR